MKKSKEIIDAGGQSSNRILGGTSLEGEVRSDGDIRVDGIIKGDVQISGKLVVGEKGQVEGTIVCANATVAGHLKGDITVEGLLSLQATAKVEGDVRTNKLSVEPGAEFSGSCNMGSVNRDKKDGQVRNNPNGKEANARKAEATA